MKTRDNKVAKYLNEIVKACNNKIQVNRNERRAMFSILRGGFGKNDELEVITVSLDSNYAFKLKQQAIHARKNGDTSISVAYTEAWFITLNSKDDTTQRLVTDSTILVNLNKDFIRPIDGDKVKSWNRMKAGISPNH